MTARTLTLGRTTYPVVLPNTRDPRLHVAAVIITIHVLGQFGLGFRVSVPQILAAILTCAVLEVVLTFRTSRAFVWPASAMLTGSGVALILRVPGTPPDEPWSTYRWYVFAGVAALSLLTKYVIRYRGSHLFNPSNIGLVAAFVVLGSERIEPLDFWWGPLDRWTLTAYAVILGGGVLITTRLHMVGMAVTFWLTLAAGVGLLAASGHCMTAQWAFAPVCGFDFWRVIVTSPEVLIFLFFMITDPKTVPIGRVGRIVFGVLVAVASTLLMAPQTNEFGTKVALLAGLVVACAARPVLDRLLPAPGSDGDRIAPFATRLAIGRRGGVLRPAARVGVVVAAVVAVGLGVVAAESPARGTVGVPIDAALDGVRPRLDPATFPTITVDQDVADWNHEIAGPVARDLVLDLAENLELESQALLRSDPTILPAVDHGDRLDEMRDRLDEAGASGGVVVQRYEFDDVRVTLLEPFGEQEGLSLGLVSRGTVTEETYDADGTLHERTTSPFATTFAVRQVTGGRWLNVGVSCPGVPSSRPSSSRTAGRWSTGRPPRASCDSSADARLVSGWWRSVVEITGDTSYSSTCPVGRQLRPRSASRNSSPRSRSRGAPSSRTARAGVRRARHLVEPEVGPQSRVAASVPPSRAMPVASATRVSPLNAPTVRLASARPAGPTAARMSRRARREVGPVEVGRGSEPHQDVTGRHARAGFEGVPDVDRGAER